MKKEEYFVLVVAFFATIAAAVLVSAGADWTVSGTNVNGSEDTLFVYNLTNNVTNSSWSEGLSYSILNISANPTLGLGSLPSNYPWISLDTTTGMLIINSTRDNQSSRFTMFVTVSNSSGSGDLEPFNFNITAVNDIPQITGLQNSFFNMTQVFSTTINVTDEENNVPFKLNITFLSCSVAQWSSRNCSVAADRVLFNSSQYTFNNQTGLLNITFTPQRNDVGSYVISFNVTDSGNYTLPFNASKEQTVTYTVEAINSKPYFQYTCDNERSATENTPFSCYINASDIDEINNLTIRSNATGSFISSQNSFFVFNGTLSSNIASAAVNVTTLFNASWLSNFTPTDSIVGNWSINLTINDTGSPMQSNSTTFYLFIANVQDTVFLDSVPAVTAYTSNNYTLFVNASDDDLLIPDKSVYYEALTFMSNNSAVSIAPVQNVSNRTVARITFNPNNLAGGNHSIRINVTDKAGNTAFTIFNITVFNNTPPSWKPTTLVNFTLMENTSFYYNLTSNVTDPENDSLTFTYTNDTAFQNFTLGGNGIINFTPTDFDVGRHVITISASDGITPTLLNFTFDVMNLNESPRMLRPFTIDYNATVNVTNGGMNFSEDAKSSFLMNIQDEDFKIPLLQRSFYNESFNINLTIQGPNTHLFSFVLAQAPAVGSNLSIYSAIFTPNKTDVGSYNITINVTDLAGLSDLYQFNLTVTSINHKPTIPLILNQTSYINASFSLDVNASDVEDGSDNGNLTYNLTFLQGNDFVLGDGAIFDNQTGLLNITFNDTQDGNYVLNLSVKDSTNIVSSATIYLKVYGVPVFLSPAADNAFNLSETVNQNLSFRTNHSVGDNLTYSMYVNGILRYNVSSFANGSRMNWSFTPNYTDETFGSRAILIVMVKNSMYPQLNVSRNFTMNITHTNAPVLFNGSIANQQRNFDQPIIVNLSNYFSDIDSSDPILHNDLNFTVISNQTNASIINVNVVNGSLYSTSLLLTFNTGSEAFESFNVTATDSQYQNYSNQFTIQFTSPTVQSSTSSSSSSGGGSSQVKPVSLNIIVPGPLTAKKQDRLIVPVAVVNTGKITLNDVVLRNTVAKNGILRDDLIASFDESFFPTLKPGESKNLTLIVDINTKDLGLYEVTLNGTSTNPSFSDTSKLYVNVEEGDTVTEKISFTQEFIAQNPQCIEIKEIIDEARELYIKGDTTAANDKADEALEACKNAISQASRSQVREKIYQNLTDNLGIATIAAVLIGVGYYWIRRVRLQRVVQNIEQPGAKV